MTLTCPKCGTSYDVATLRLKGKDRTATCGKCTHRFVVRLLKPAAGTGTQVEGTIVGGRTNGPAATPASHVRVAVTVLDGPEKDRVYRLTAPVTVVGRTTGDIQLPDPRVSSRHAQLELARGEVWLRDLGSTNGSFVNGQRVDHVRLTHMDELTLGGTRLLYTYMQDLASAYDDLAASR